MIFDASVCLSVIGTNIVLSIIYDAGIKLTDLPFFLFTTTIFVGIKQVKFSRYDFRLFTDFILAICL